MKSLSKKLSPLFLSAAASCFTNIPAFAQSAVTWDTDECGSNPTVLTDACTATPSRYEVTIYEMGLCESNPVLGTNFDASKCVTTATSSSGLTEDLSGGATYTLTEATQTRPSNGLYPFAYLVVGSEFGLRGSYQVNGVTYTSTGVISSGNGLVQSGGTATNFQATLDEFNLDADSCASEFTANNIHGGTIYARLTDANLVTAGQTGAGTGFCPGRPRVIGVFEPGSPINITDSTTALQVQFVTTDTGMTVIPDNSGVPDTFTMGPLMTVFTVIN